MRMGGGGRVIRERKMNGEKTEGREKDERARGETGFTERKKRGRKIIRG